jgi:hypothetical protein
MSIVAGIGLCVYRLALVSLDGGAPESADSVENFPERADQ